MTTKSASFPNAQSNLRRFSLMLSGEDVLDEQVIDDQAPKGLPHERFLLGNAVPLAPVLLLAQSPQSINPDQTIACLQPVHLHATRDHLILMGQNQIDLTETESKGLLKIALPFIEEDFQNPLLFADQYFWFIPAGPFSSLSSYSVDQALGRNIDWWMPRDSHEEGIAKRWRKLQNEIQMLWHIDPINEKREERGMPSINSIWISGIGKLQDIQAPVALTQAQQLCGRHPLLAGLSKYLDIPIESTLNIKNLGGSFAWLEQPEALWSELAQALIDKSLDELLLIDFPNGKTRERVFTSKTIVKKSWAFWKKPEVMSWKEMISL